MVTLPTPDRTPPATAQSFSLRGRANHVSATDTGRSQKMAELLAASIEVEISEAGWPVGEVLGTETELLQRFGVSRAVFREAVRILENHGVAHMRRGPGGGLVVAAPDAGAVTRGAALLLDHAQVTSQHLFEARLGIELLTSEAAARSIDEQGIDRLRAELALELQPGDKEWVAHSHGLHVSIAELAGNPALTLFTRVLVSLTEQHGRPPYDALPEPAGRALRDEVYQAHVKIVEAIIGGDASLARHRMRRHLEVMHPFLQ
jgi:DNA-binding FadR family transcriptional regulator